MIMAVYTTHGLPFLPGNTFTDIAKSEFHKQQTLDYCMPRCPVKNPNQKPFPCEKLTTSLVDTLSSKYIPLTYGESAPKTDPAFIPTHVALHKKVLRFYAYFMEKVELAPLEKYRVRPVIIYYFLEDDTMCIREPEVVNSGLMQGKLVQRQLFPRNGKGDAYHWKDLNVGIDLIVYGVTYRITHCDLFTKDFLESEGIIMNEPESAPADPHTEQRIQPPHITVTPSDFDKLKQFLTLDQKVLRFYAMWEEPGEQPQRVIIHYYLVDDSVEIREVHEPNSGRDPFPVLLRRHKVPKSIKPIQETFPSCVLEVTSKEVEQYFCPLDFKVGERFSMMGRQFLIYDCDEFTRNYYQQNFSDMEQKPFPLDLNPQPEVKMANPPYNGFGSLEDSLQNCFSLIPRPPKKDLIKYLENENKVLRYSARLDSQNPCDSMRVFIISYHPCNDMISIYERPVRNSGVKGGKFLEKTRVPKPGSTVEHPKYYKVEDFTIGATIEVFRHRFILTDADHFVLKHLETIAEHIPAYSITSLRKHLQVDPHLCIEFTQPGDKSAIYEPEKDPEETTQLPTECTFVRSNECAFPKC